MPSITNDSIEFDREHIWHPYTSMTTPIAATPIISAKSVYLTQANGDKLLDGMSSWWSTIHGYNHPTLNQAASDQLAKMSHVMFGGLTHPSAIKLCELLIDLSPKDLSKVFLSDSGSVAVEVAMKMAIQYWHSQGKAEKHRFIALERGYHGDTFAAMSVCDPVNGMHHLFKQSLIQQEFCKSPAEHGSDQALTHLAQILEQHHDIAALILEPIVQGAGGMLFYEPDFLQEARKLCNQHQVLLIADEIATGFGRTGELFACDHAAICPDILCLGKALTGGYMTLAATLCTDKIALGISEGEAGVFMHGPTFMGNPLACAVACASIELLLDQNWRQTVANIEQMLTVELSAAKNIKGVKDVRVLGAIGVIELDTAVDMSIIQPQIVDAGIWVRPFGRLVYIMPAYIISDNELKILCNKLVNVVRNYLKP